MAISSENLKILRYIQERQNVRLQDISKRYKKNQVSIRREIHHINTYYGKELITIYNSVCSTRMTYQELANTIHSIPLKEYVSNRTERTQVFLVMAYFEPWVNTTQLYESWGLSLTTKKNDISYLRKVLKSYDLEIIPVHQKGLAIQGNDLKFQVLVSNILYSLFDLDKNRNIMERVSNTPVDSQCFAYMSGILPYIEKAEVLLDRFLHNYNLKITSLSEKFGLIFIALTIRKPEYNRDDYHDLQLPLTNFYFVDDRDQNMIFNYVITLLDYSEQLEFPYDTDLMTQTEKFVDTIINSIEDPIYTRQELINEIYNYFYKVITMDYFHVELADRLVRYLDDDLKVLYENIQKYSHKTLEKYGHTLTSEQLTTITFIYQKMILRNKIINTPNSEHKMRVTIITHASYERIDYFIYQLKAVFEVEIVQILSLAQRENAHKMTYDYIFCLSERIYNILKSEGYPVIRLHYYLSATDQDVLDLFGFNRVRTKFLAKEFVKEIEALDDEALEVYLKNRYSNHFI